MRIAAVNTPLPLAFIAAGAVLAGAAYCQAHTLVSGGVIPLGFSLLWSAATILPWVAAGLVFQRRAARYDGPAAASGAAVALAVVAILLASSLAAWLGADFGAELYARLPALPAAALIGILWVRHTARPEQTSHIGGEALPCARGDILLAAAAGNYVELRLKGRTLLWRRTMREAERMLGDGFVRIHRSYIVPRARIVAVRSTELELDGGQRLPISRRYRAAATRLA